MIKRATVAVLLSFLALVFLWHECVAVTWAGEITIHEVRNAPVVTLVDPDRSDPYDYRFVLVQGREGFVVVVDRYDGRVWLCIGVVRNHTHEGKVPLDGCTLVYSGPVLPKRR